MSRKTPFVLLLVLLVALTAACAAPTPTPSPSPAPSPTPTPAHPPELQGGVLAVFDVLGHELRVWTTNPEAIAELERWQAGERESGIPNGALVAGPGPADYNAPWDWHLDPEDIDIADVTIELCDGTPDMVQDDLEYWLGTVGRYCPWQAELVDLLDYR